MSALIRRIAPLALAAGLLLTPTVGVTSNAASLNEEPGAGAIAFDLLFVRPISLVTTVAGAGLFVLSVPIGAVQGDPLQAAEPLVLQPARYTFVRPLGQSD